MTSAGWVFLGFRRGVAEVRDSDSALFRPPSSESFPCLKMTLTLHLFCPLPACNCDPMGSVSMQCHNNGTCRCRQGFVGYKCDKCELNYFQNRVTHQCEECPVCYGLVKKQVGKINESASAKIPMHACLWDALS